MNFQNPTAAQAQAQAAIFEMAMANPEMNESPKVDLKAILNEKYNSLVAQFDRNEIGFGAGFVDAKTARKIRMSLLEDMVIVSKALNGTL